MSKLLFIHLPKFHVENFEDLAIIYSSFINDAKYTGGFAICACNEPATKAHAIAGLVLHRN